MVKVRKKSTKTTFQEDRKPYPLSPDHIKRDELLSMLLQDRNVLRLISAPHGFGKTELVREYAARMFAGRSIIWIDGDDPTFLLALDDGSSEFFPENSEAELVVIDNLPWLHEGRAQALSDLVDMALYKEREVIITLLPSCDCLSILQPDRICIRASDLYVKEQECKTHFGYASEEEARALSAKRWKDASAQLFGHAPAVIWADEKEARRACIFGLFSEKLSSSLICALFSMLLLGAGKFDDLEHIHVSMSEEDRRMLLRDYPIFDVDIVAGTFKAGLFDIADLKEAIIANNLEEIILDGVLPLTERILMCLFEKEEFNRGIAIMDLFCSEERCAEWLLEKGWDLLDSGDTDIVTHLLERCPATAYATSPELIAMHAWLSGLSGNAREACHIASQLLYKEQEREETKVARIASYLVLVMFDEDSITSLSKPKFSSDQAPTDAQEFLACVLDHCTIAEISRALCQEGRSQDARYEKARRTPGKQRVRTLSNLFTGYFHAFKGTRAFHIGLHILSSVDSSFTKRLLQELGCEAIVEMRRKGVKSFTSALLIRDLWQSGYFGLIGPVADRRDTQILEGASHMLNMLAQRSGSESAFVPWEVRRGNYLPVNDPLSTRPRSAPDIEPMFVRLFGGFDINIGEEYLSEGRWRKKARAFFAMLVINQGRDVPRDDILEQLWPKFSRAHALDNFYTVWSNCTSILGENPYLERNGEFCRVDPRFVRSDVAEFEQLNRHLLMIDRDSNHLLDTYAKIEALYRGPLMPSEVNIRVLNAQRERYRDLFVDAMIAATESALRINDKRVALWFARKAIEENQSREDVYRMLMKAQIAAGQRCPAIKTYLQCRDFLRNSLGLDPSLETRELYNSLVTKDPELLRLSSSSLMEI